MSCCKVCWGGERFAVLTMADGSQAGQAPALQVRQTQDLRTECLQQLHAVSSAHPAPDPEHA